MRNGRSCAIGLFGILAFTLAVPASAQWTTTTSVDEMTEQKSCYATSPQVGPVKKMGFPYADVVGWLGVGSDSNSEWVYFGFSESPNLLNATIEDGYTLVSTRIKWDDEVEEVTLSQTWGAQFLHFNVDERAIAKIATSNSVLLELDWYGAGKTYFRFSLAGSSEALKKMRGNCVAG